MRSREPVTSYQLWSGGIRRYRALRSCDGNRRAERRLEFWYVPMMHVNMLQMGRLVFGKPFQIGRLSDRRRRISLAAVVGLVLASAVSASAGSNSPTKRLFADAAKDVVKRSSIAVYVPVSLQSLDTAAIDGCAFSESGRDSYSISIYGRVTEHGKTEPLPCEANNAALLAEIHGDTKPMRNMSKRPKAQGVALQSGAPGWFIPVACAGSCAPATLYWQTPMASYWLQLKLGSVVSIAQQRRELLEIADSLQLISAER